MTTSIFKKTRNIAVAATLFALLGPLSLFADSRRLVRTGVGNVIDVVGARGSRYEKPLDGYVRSVRNGGRDIALATTYGIIKVLGDGSTRVSYRGQRYSTNDLETGDRLRVFGQVDRSNIYAQSIEVLRSASEVLGGDTRRSDEFQIATSDGRQVWVDARDADRSDRSQINRLRVGDQVSVSGFFDRNGSFIASSILVDDTVLRDGRHRGDENDRRIDRRSHHNDDDEGDDNNDEDDD
jgi:hypothetical protein